MTKTKQFAERLKDLQKKRVLKAGFFDSDKYENGLSVASVAFWNEYGVPENNLPPRPFMRITAKKHGDEWKKILGNAVKAHLNGKKPIDNSLQSIGDYVVAQIQETIKSNIPPENKLATKQRKERTKEVIVKADESAGLENDTNVRGTLIDTGLMLSSVRFEIESD